MKLVQGRGKMTILSTVSVVLLRQSAMDICNDCSDVSKGRRVNVGYACSLFSTVTSQSYG
jgi:hypothetical protein